MTFFINQKVVCINDDDNLYNSPNSGPIFEIVKGEIYTVREKSFNIYHNIHTILLAEFPNRINPLVPESTDPGYAAHRFRPLIDLSDDVSLFTHMLKQKELEDA